MKKHNNVKRVILKIADWMEVAIAILLVVMIAVLGIKFAVELYKVGYAGYSEETISRVLSASFALIIGVEFVRMLSRHSIGSIIEILLFSTARGMIVEHQDGKETVFLIVAMLLVMVIRKYLMIPGDMEEHGTEE